MEIQNTATMNFKYCIKIRKTKHLGPTVQQDHTKKQQNIKTVNPALNAVTMGFVFCFFLQTLVISLKHRHYAGSPVVRIALDGFG